MCPIAISFLSSKMTKSPFPQSKETTDDRHIKQCCDKVPPSQKIKGWRVLNLHNHIPLTCLPSFSFPSPSVLVPFSFFVELLYFFIELVISMTFIFLTFVIISNGSDRFGFQFLVNFPITIRPFPCKKSSTAAHK